MNPTRSKTHPPTGAATGFPAAGLPAVSLAPFAALGFAVLLTVSFAACGGGAPEEAPPAAAESGAAEVEYEAAYPEEVSGEALSEEDVTQQPAPHAHGDETHEHGEDDEHPDDHDH